MIPLDSEALDRASRGNPAWLADARSRAFGDYQRLEPPSPKDELWRYVELDVDLGAYALPLEPAGSPSPEGEGFRLSLVDGLAVGDDIYSDDFTLRSLAREWAEGETGPVPFASPGPAADKFSAAHRAFALDGASLRVAPNRAVVEPLHVDVTSAAPNGISFPRVSVEMGRSSQASLVVSFTSPGDIEAFVVPEIDVVIAPGSILQLTVVQRWGSRTTSLGRGRVEAARDASVTFAEAGLGGALSRLHLAVDLVGRGASASIVGAYFGDGEQVLDYRYFMRHAAESTTSDMFLKGAVEDAALSIFTGMIRIEEEGQRTNAFQTNRNLILSDEAAAQSVPNLEILANDVKCGHGSTMGPLDDEQRYYLMSRGLDRDAADRLQVRGFFEEALARFPDKSILDPVRSRIAAKYEAAQAGGRL